MRFFQRASTPTPDGDLFLIVGLGNPGRSYIGTRHNLGFMAVEQLASRHGLRFASTKFEADTAKGTIKATPVLLAMPQTFMNESGRAVSRLMTYFRVPTQRLIVVCDDFELAFGTIRIRREGSSGGQNGLRSIIESIGTQDFIRVRIGVGRPEHSAIGHVLSPFTPDQKKQLPLVLEAGCDAVEFTLASGPQEAMNRFNRNWIGES